MGSGTRRPRLLDGDPPELLVYDELAPCPYLEGEQARLPMRLPVRPLTDAEFDLRLRRGERRQGLLLYRPNCPSCKACEAIRIDVRTYQPNKTQRRILRRGDALFRIEQGAPTLSEERVALYNRHKEGRGLMGDGDPIDASGYGAFLVDSCVESMELRYRIDGALRGVAVVDRGSTGLSAVYTYFDPDLHRYSPGVYSVLKQMEMCRRLGLRYLYLGLYVGNCPSMAYKARYLPHERLVDGVWQRFTEHQPAAPEASKDSSGES